MLRDGGAPDGDLGGDSGGAGDNAGEGGAGHHAAAERTAVLLRAGHGEERALERAPTRAGG